MPSIRSSVALAMLLGGCGRLSFDGVAGDAGPGSDARIDAVPGAFCAGRVPQPLFCDDFSDGVMAPWVPVQADFGTVVEANGVLTSTIVNLANTSEITRAFWKQDIGTASGGVEVAFDIEAPTASFNDPVVLELVFGQGGGDEHYFDWVHKLNGPAYVEEIVVRPPAADQYFYYPTPTAISSGLHRIGMTFDAVNQQVVVVIDGATVISSSTNDTMAGDYALHIGVPYAEGPSAPWELRFDNLEVNLP